MFKKILLLLVMPVVLVCEVCFADAASDLSQVESYVKSGQFVQAEQLCISITQANIGNDVALKARGKLAAIYIMTGKVADANTLVDAITNTFKSNAELPAILYGVMGRHKQAREFQLAQSLSSRICQEFPASEQAQRIQLDTGKEQAFRLIANGKFQDAEETINNMLTAAAGNPTMPATLFKIAREFKEVGGYDVTIRIYQKIAQEYSNSEFADKARMGVDKLKIWNLIKAGDASGALVALDKLIADYKGNDDLPHTVHGVALKLEEKGFYPQAKTIYQKVKTDYADDRMAEVAAVDLKLCDIRAMVRNSSYASVKAELNKLMSDFSGHHQLPKAIWRVGAEYYQQAIRLEVQGSTEQTRELYQNAAEVLDIVISQLPSSSAIPEACNYAGTCYEKLGEYEKANACYQKTIDNFPAYGLRWNMMFLLGRNYEMMKKEGTISAEQADMQVKAMYKRLLTEYPDCQVARHVRKLLAR